MMLNECSIVHDMTLHCDIIESWNWTWKHVERIPIKNLGDYVCLEVVTLIYALIFGSFWHYETKWVIQNQILMTMNNDTEI